MNPKFYWMKGPWPGKLAISARPRVGDWLEDEISGWRTPGWMPWSRFSYVKKTKTGSLGAGPILISGSRPSFRVATSGGHGVPSFWDDASRAVEEVGEMLRQGRNVAVHCRQGIGGSGMIAAAVLSKHGSTPDEALKLISDLRGLRVPETLDRREWLRKFSKREAPSALSLTRASVK